MLKLGEKIINQIYLGDKKIAKAYLGDKLVFQADKPIFLEYIESDGNSYIDTKQYIRDGVTLEIIAQGLGDQGLVYSFDQDWQGASFKDTGSQWFANGTYFAGSSLNKTKIESSWSGVSQDYTNIVTINGETATYKRTGRSFNDLLLFAGKNYLVPQTLWKGRIYSYKLYKNNVLIQDLRPCIDANGVVCMYDTVSHKYFYNQGTGEFIPSHIFVEYIESTGTQYIDTGLNLDACRVEIVAECTTLPDISGYQQLFSKNYDYAGCAIFACDPNWGASSALQTNTPSNKKSTIIANFSLENSFPKVVMTVDGVTIEYVRTSLPPLANHNWSLMSAPNRSFGLKGRVYSCKMYDLENNLLRDLRPCIDHNNVVCMYDMVTKEYFYNAGTGTFGYTEE